MKIGASYYPELCDKNRWREDLSAGREIGLTALRCGEFAWDYLEPTDGKFTFDWALEFLDLAHELEYDVIWCTPSATPPPRFFTLYENLNAVNHKGEVMPVGVRRNYTAEHPDYLKRCEEMAGQLAMHLAGHPAIVGWQIDNEIAGDGFCSRGGYWTTAGFREYLKERFQTLDAFNAAVGGGVWGENYHDWNEIPVPGPVISIDSFPPGLKLEFQRYHSYAWQKFYSIQYHALKKGGATQPVTTNFYNFEWDVPFDLHEWKAELDSIALGNYLEGKNESILQFASMRSITDGKRPFWILEQKAGQQRAQNLYPDDLVNRLTDHLRLCRSCGVEYAIYWHLRQHTHGCEEEHGAVLNHDGRIGRVGMAIKKAIKLSEDTQTVPVVKNAGVVFDFQQHWAQRWRPGHIKWDYRVLIQEEYFPAMRELYGEVALPGTDGIAGENWQVLLVPHYQMDLGITPELLKLAENGSTIILTADYARLDKFNAVRPVALLEALCSALPVPDLEMIQLDTGADYHAADGTKADYFYALPFGKIEITSNTAPTHLKFRYGKGKIAILLGCFAATDLVRIIKQIERS